MRKALMLSLLSIILGGCASEPAPRDISGIWINQAAIDEAAKGGGLLDALSSSGPTLEWSIDAENAKATWRSSFERDEGTLVPDGSASWKVNFYGGENTDLKLEGSELIQAATEFFPRQAFVRPAQSDVGEVSRGTNADLFKSVHFEQALKSAYLGGEWRVLSGAGQGAKVTFSPKGQVSGLPGINGYELCLGGDCATMSGGLDSLWLQQGEMGAAHIFVRKGRTLEIFEAVDVSAPDEMPQFYPGKREWALEKL